MKSTDDAYSQLTRARIITYTFLNFDLPSSFNIRTAIVGTLRAAVAASVWCYFPGKATYLDTILPCIAGEVYCANINVFVGREMSEKVSCKPCFCYQSLIGCPFSFPSEIIIVLPLFIVSDYLLILLLCGKCCSQASQNVYLKRCLI